MASEILALAEEVKRFSKTAEELRKKVDRHISEPPKRRSITLSMPELEIVVSEGH